MCGDEIPYSCQLSTVNFVLICSCIIAWFRKGRDDRLRMSAINYTVFVNYEFIKYVFFHALSFA